MGGVSAGLGCYQWWFPSTVSSSLNSTNVNRLTLTASFCERASGFLVVANIEVNAGIFW
jgi:hypothetical protein